eukprot:COSAG01_NODE_132_length_24759_cov_13.862298_7_plen_54_part_00
MAASARRLRRWLLLRKGGAMGAIRDQQSNQIRSEINPPYVIISYRAILRRKFS